MNFRLTTAKIISVVFFSSVLSAIAQPKPKVPFRERLFYGGSLGLYFSSDQSVVVIAPIVGYKVTEKLSAGLGPSYSYYKYRLYYTPTNYTTEETSVYGGKIFSQYRILEQVVLHAEYVLSNLEVFKPVGATDFSKERIYVNSLLLGGGYVQRMGGNSAFVITILYDVLGDPYSPYYQQPVISAGVQLGF